MDSDYKEILFNKYCPTCVYKNVAEEAWPCSECLDYTCNLNSSKPVKYIDKDGDKAAEKPKLLNPIQKRIIQNGIYKAVDDGSIGYSMVDVSVSIPSGYLKPEGTLEITENGLYRCAKYEKTNVNVQPTLQTKTVKPTISEQNITADDDFDGLDTVIVAAIPFATTEEVRNKFGGEVNGR